MKKAYFNRLWFHILLAVVVSLVMLMVIMLASQPLLTLAAFYPTWKEYTEANHLSTYTYNA